MTLFDAIYDFFFNTVFNGVSNLSVHFQGTSDSNGIDLGALFVPINASYYNGQVIDFISFRAWLSCTCTIITLVIILVCIGLFIRWLFKFVSGSLLLK